MIPDAVNALATASVKPPAERPLAADPKSHGAREAISLRELADADPRAAKVLDAARDFEAVFVRQLLRTTRFAGEIGDKGHGAMAVDALASAVSSGGGLGLAKHIAESLLRQQLAQMFSDEDGTGIANP